MTAEALDLVVQGTPGRRFLFLEALIAGIRRVVSGRRNRQGRISRIGTLKR
jgi:hypothetical protein